MPASSASSPSRIVESGVSSAGLITIVLPRASAGPSFQLAMLSGKFQGVISPTTPSGSRKVDVDAARDRDRLAVVLVDRPGVEVEDLRDHPDLAARAAIGLPTFSDSMRESSSWCSSTSVASRRSSRARSAGATARQAGNAALARATASSVSSTPACSSSAIGFSVAGLRTVSVMR